MLDPWLLKRLACPRCQAPLTVVGGSLTCERAHLYPITPDGIPVLVVNDVRQTHWAATHALEHAAAPSVADLRASGDVDPVVQEAIGATGGNLYAHLIGRLPRYPIPHLSLDGPPGASFLDIGCHWGRWCVAAARKGWRVVGIDPYLPGVRAAKRVAEALGVDAQFVVGDGRYLPFRATSFDLVHSYSVLQHFSEDDVARCAQDIGRILMPGGHSKIQMAQRFGLLNVLHQAHRGFRRPRLFQVRYWRLGDLCDTFSKAIGPTALSVDGFFSLNAQSADLDLLRPMQRPVVHISNGLTRLADRLPWLIHLADSVYVNSTKPAA